MCVCHCCSLSLHPPLRLDSYPANRFSTIFLDIIHMLIYDICFSLSDLLCITGSRSSVSLQLTQIQFSLLLSNIPLYISTKRLLYPFISQWTSRLSPCYKKCFSEPWGYICVFELWFSRGILPIVGLLGDMAV